MKIGCYCHDNPARGDECNEKFFNINPPWEGNSAPLRLCGGAFKIVSEAILETQNVTIGYLLRKQKPKIVAQELSLSLFAGEVVCLIGPNGSGKSTLLRTLSNLQPPLAGEIFLEHHPLTSLSAPELAKRLSIVLTDRLHLGQFQVATLVALGRYPYTDWSGKLSREDLDVVYWALDAVGAGALAHRDISELSDGEQQKVMIARALAQQPHAILLDEPTAFLDLPRRVEIMSLLRRLARRTGTAILLSTHDLELSLRTADRIWLLTPNRPIETGAPEDLVLSGKLAQAFQSDGVEFDQQHGTFTLSRHPNAHVRLHGNGLFGHWTRRALEREGFAVNATSEDCPIHIHTEIQNERRAWRLQIDGKSSCHSTIYELLLTLRSQMEP